MTPNVVVASGRSAALAVMLDACTVTRATRGPLDTGTGTYPSTPATVHTGPCRVKTAGPRETAAAGGQQQLRRHILVLPFGSTALAAGDVVTVTGAAAGTYTVVDRSPGTTATADRYEVEER